MPDYFIDTDATDISVSCLNVVINKNIITQNAGEGANNNSKISRIRTILKERASAPNLSQTGTVNFSDFRSAQVLTGCIRTKPESSSTYCDSQNGEIRTAICEDTVMPINSSSGTKIYEFCISGGNFVTQTNDNTRNYTGKDGNTATGGGYYNVVLRDGTSDANIFKNVQVTYAGGDKLYNNIQDKTNPALNTDK